MGMKLGLSLKEEQRLQLIQNRMLKRYLDLGGRRKLHNNEHNNSHPSPNINSIIK
jgi:hypothetical protein